MANIKISDLHPTGSALSQQFTNSEELLFPLSKDEQGSIQGGWLAGAAVVVGVVGLGIAAYQTFYSEEERVSHRKFILEGKIAGRGSYGGPGLGGSAGARTY